MKKLTKNQKYTLIALAAISVILAVGYYLYITFSDTKQTKIGFEIGDLYIHKEITITKTHVMLADSENDMALIDAVISSEKGDIDATREYNNIKSATKWLPVGYKFTLLTKMV